jgi:hypothetical protein
MYDLQAETLALSNIETLELCYPSNLSRKDPITMMCDIASMNYEVKTLETADYDAILPVVLINSQQITNKNSQIMKSLGLSLGYYDS